MTHESWLMTHTVLRDDRDGNIEGNVHARVRTWGWQGTFPCENRVSTSCACSYCHVFEQYMLLIQIHSLPLHCTCRANNGIAVCRYCFVDSRVWKKGTCKQRQQQQPLTSKLRTLNVQMSTESWCFAQTRALVSKVKCCHALPWKQSRQLMLCVSDSLKLSCPSKTGTRCNLYVWLVYCGGCTALPNSLEALGSTAEEHIYMVCPRACDVQLSSTW